MRFSEILATSLVAPLVAAHGGIPGAPKIMGLAPRDIAALKTRNIFGGHAGRSDHGSELQARQGGNAQNRCGKEFGCATCAEGYCCSSGGYCGQGQDYCQAPDSQFEYGPGADANKLPTGGSTRNIDRSKVGSVVYGGEGIYVCTKPGQVAITYDDGPYTYTTDLLNMFQSYNFKATFFITGINLYKGAVDDASKPWAAMIKRMFSDGHQVASHTWSHQDLSAITKEQRYEQMIRLEMATANLIGKVPTYMRPPYSSCTAASGCQQDMADLGYHVSYFDLDTDDYNNITPEKAQIPKDNVYKAINPSDPKTQDFLAIAHDIHYQTVYNLTGYMLDLMVKKGYKGVTMGECLGDPEANWYRNPTNRVATSSVFTPPACASTRSSSSSASTSMSRTSSAPTSTPTTVSPDASCGSNTQYTCIGFSGGECCSQYGYCGNTAGHCGDGCQAGFGKCGIFSSSSSVASTSSGISSTSGGASSSSVPSTASTKASSTTLGTSTSASSSAPSSTPSRVTSPDATCGGTNGYTCVGFSGGECCSQYGYCGNTADHCGTGCNPLYGNCNSGSSSSSGSASSTPAASSSSRPASSSSSAPVSSSSQPASSSSAPGTSSSKPASSSAPATSSSKPASSSSVPVTSSSKPASSSSVPATSSSRPASSSSSQPASSSSRPASSSAPVSSSSRPASSSSAPVTSSSRPASSSSAPVTSSSKPASSSSAPATSSSKPASSSSSQPASSSATSTRISSSSTRVSSTPAATPTGKLSPNGLCGPLKGYHCIGHAWGSCCSQWGYCGSDAYTCGIACNKLYGKCN